MSKASPQKTVPAIVLHPDDTVATLLAGAKTGDNIATGSHQPLVAKEDIPIYFKVCLSDHKAGSDVIKYGQTIGTAQTAIRKGEKVHIHNMTSKRGRHSGH